MKALRAAKDSVRLLGLAVRQEEACVLRQKVLLCATGDFRDPCTSRSFNSTRGFAKSRSKGKATASGGGTGGGSFDLSKVQGLMEKAQERLQSQLASLRTGRASSALLDSIQVNVLGENLPLRSAASITVQNAQTLCVTVFDSETLAAVEKSLRESALRLNPQVKGQDLLVPIPRMTEETRKEILKMVKAEGEAARIAIRNARKDGMSLIKQEPSEDDRKRLEKQIQKVTDKFSEEVENLIRKKERDLSEA